MKDTNNMLGTTVKGGIGMLASASIWSGEHFTWLEPAVRAVMFYGGAIVVVLTIGSIALDVKWKWRHRNDPRHPHHRRQREEHDTTTY